MRGSTCRLHRFMLRRFMLRRFTRPWFFGHRFSRRWRTIRPICSSHSAPAPKRITHPRPYSPAFFRHAHGGKAQGNYQKSKSRQHQSQSLRRKGKGCHSYKYRQQPLACKCGAARTGSAYTVKGGFLKTPSPQPHTWGRPTKPQATPPRKGRGLGPDRPEARHTPATPSMARTSSFRCEMPRIFLLSPLLPEENPLVAALLSPRLLRHCSPRRARASARSSAATSA